VNEPTDPINLSALRLFRMVAQLGSVTRAADALFVTQPAVSKAIGLLERSTGLQLVRRSGKTIQITDAGQTLAKHADRIFNAADDAREAMLEIAGLDQGRLVIGASTTIGNYLVPALLGAFHAAHPAITLAARIGNTHDILEDLRWLRVEIALIEGETIDPEFVREPFETDELVLLLPPAHPWCQREAVHLSDLRHVPFLPRELGSGTRHVVDHVFARHEVSPTIAMELGNSEAIKAAVIAGLGVSILSRLCVQADVEAGRLVTRPFVEQRVARELLLVQRAGDRLSPASLRFIALLRDRRTALANAGRA